MKDIKNKKVAILTENGFEEVELTSPMQEEKAKLVHLIKRFSADGYTITETVHPFFGKMSSQEWALFAYKHLDHHLTQFGA